MRRFGPVEEAVDEQVDGVGDLARNASVAVGVASGEARGGFAA